MLQRSVKVEILTIFSEKHYSLQFLASIIQYSGLSETLYIRAEQFAAISDLFVHELKSDQIKKW